MSDHELRTALQRLAEPVAGNAPPDLRETVITEVDRRRRRRWGGSITAAAAVAAVALGAGLLTDGSAPENDAVGPDETQAGAGWSRIADSPLSARHGQLAVWTGAEMLVIGGTDQPPCPPTADCVGPSGDQLLADGAAYDPGADRWRRIAEAPQSLTYAQAVWTGTEAIVLAPRLAPSGGEAGQQAGTFAYDPADDTWRRLDDPPPGGFLRLGGGEGGPVLAWQDYERPGLSDWLLDPESGAWSRLPDDPFPATFDRSYTWDGADLLLTAVPSSGVDDEDQDHYQLARLDPGAREWTVLGETPVTFGEPAWFVTGGLLVNPTQPADGLGDAPGGVMDLRTGDWRPVPGPAPEDFIRLTCDLPRIGVAGQWVVGGGPVLVSVAPASTTYAPDCPQLGGMPQVGVWTGEEVIVYGGVDDSFRHNLTIGLRWTPPLPE